MNTYFSELGKRVYARWEKENFSLEAFPTIATKALTEKPPAKHVDLKALMSDFLLKDEQSFQTSSGFGQPELIVYDNPKFYIQLLFWLDGTTDIHQHGFSGAFHVMEGSSIHSEFEFLNPLPVTAHFRLGDLKLKKTGLLETGSTVPILSGNGCIHSLFHLETPSVTVVVRTHSDPGSSPQFTYLPPHVALDPVKEDALTLRRKQLLDAMERTGDDRYAALVNTMVGTLDLERGFFILQNCMGHLRAIGAWERVWKTFAKKHGKAAVMISPTLDEIVRRDALVAMRSSIEDVEHRFFLALLLTVPDRERILAMIGERFPGKPSTTIARWAGELAITTEGGTWILDACFPEDLQVADEEQIPLFLGALDHLIQGGKPPAWLAKFPKVFKSLRESLSNSSWRVLIR
ncbi:MAG: hypothetical protein WAN16_04300 [Chthoniobacterales bacterium]